MDEKLIHSLWDRFDRSDVSELVYETNDGRLKLKRERQNTVIRENAVNMPYEASAVTTVKADSAAEIQNKTKSAENIKQTAGDNGSYVRSPLPGTFYRAASPDDEPFVIIGKHIHKGDVVGIVESMKMMNEITAQTDGVVAEILAEDGSMVGYDEKLIRLET